MTKEMEKFDVESFKEKFNFQQAVDVFLMAPRKPWLYMMLYLGKERALRMVEKKDIGNNIVIANWTDEFAIVISSDYAALWAEYEMNCFYDAKEEESLNNMLVYTAVALMLLPDEWYAENCLSTFDMIVERMCEKFGTSLSMYTQPKELTNLVGCLLDADCGSLYNPYAGICSYSQIVGLNVKYHGQEVSGACFIGKLRCLISGKENFEIECGDESWDTWLGNSTQFDYIVSTPPFGLELDEKVSKWRDASIDFLERSSRDARKKSVGVYPASICYHAFSKSLIKDLITRDILDTVVLLPKNIFPQTAIQTAIIVVNKEKTNRGFVRLIDASECYNKDGRKNVLDFETISTLLNSDSDNRVKVISTDEIANNEYDITPKVYAQSQEVAFPEGYEVVDFRDILEQCPTRKQYYAEDGYMAKIPQLSTDPFNCERNVEEFEYFRMVDNVVKVEEPVILISRIREAKPTYCIASSEKPLFIHANVIPFRIKKDCEWVEPHYLCLELSNRIKNVFFGANIPSLSINRLVNVRLAFPSRLFDEQKRLFEVASYQSKLAKAQELGLQEVIDKLKADYMNEVRARRHDMSPHIGVLDMIECKLRQYVGQIDMGEDMSEKMIRALDYYRAALDELKKIVDVLSQENEFGKSEVIDLNVYFQGRSNNSSGYVIEYTCDSYVVEEELIEEPWLVNADSRYFARVVNNIIANAEKHGFVDSERKDYKLDIRLGLNDDRTMYQIDFANNGKSLPTGFDKRLYGIRGEKAGCTAGAGIGGHIVKSFVENYNGDYDLFMDNNEVVIRILLPIFRKGE